MPQNSFNKGFNSVYYAQVHCPVCKEKIYANALVCPHCKTDFTNPAFQRRTNWQRIAMRIVLVLSVALGTMISVTSIPTIVGILIGLAFYGIGHIVVQKIQSIKNYLHR